MDGEDTPGEQAHQGSVCVSRGRVGGLGQIVPPSDLATPGLEPGPEDHEPSELTITPRCWSTPPLRSIDGPSPPGAREL